MNAYNYKHLVGRILPLFMVVFISNHAIGQGVVLAGNYDGTHYDLSSAGVGADPTSTVGYVYAEAVPFTVAGTGSFNLTTLTLPLVTLYLPSDSTPNFNNYRISIVSDDNGQPTDNAITSLTPGVIGSSTANYSFDINGAVEGGVSYWLLFSPIAPDNGTIDWLLNVSPFGNPAGIDARRWSMGGVPEGPWYLGGSVSGLVQPAFLLAGVASVPEPADFQLAGLTLAALLGFGYQHRKLSKTLPC